MRLAVRNLILLSTALVFVTGYCPASPQRATSASSNPASSKSESSKSSSFKSKSTSKSKSHKKGRRKTSWKRHGQQGIQAERVLVIQEALVREKYLTGEPSGVWDARSQAAMAKYQSDNGWQSKVTPDSRALIKLGLGPDRATQHALVNGAPSSHGMASATASRASGTPDKQ